MRFVQHNQKSLNARVFYEEDFSVLDYEQLLKVNGAGGSSGGGSSSGPSGGSSSSSGTDSRGYPSSTSGYNPNSVSNLEVEPRYTEQTYFSDIYGDKFGNNACAATSLLNEISEQYTRETGHALPSDLRDAAMDAAVNSGSVSSTNAFVSNWENAANSMANAVGLQGEYTYKY